ncbi:MDR family MFS transporter [Jonesia quinghaiensis]|uniref:MDR family MFS transporter n=1 Tax=Jonesia quinghaiensis TaxID=262806 RepID=UPI0003FE3137|nr:MDR family MFS transporter [Jonesia quinghaiensis]
MKTPHPTTTVDAPPTASTRSPTQQSIMLLFIGLILTQLMSSLNQTILSTALPTIVGELNGVEHMTWVITAFILGVTIMMPIYGKISDMLGRKPLLLIAIAIFMVGSVLGGLSSTMEGLILARAVQGIGGGGLMILSQAAIADVIPARDRGKYMGIMGGVFAFSSVAGPLIGGWMTEGPGWRWAFWLNIPLGLIALAATARFLNVPRPQLTARPVIDYLGMALLAVTTTALVLVLTWGGAEYAWSSPTILGLSAVAVLGTLAFVMTERRAKEPIMPLDLFRDRNFVLTTVAAIATGIAMFGAIGYLPTYLQMAGGYSATTAGLLMSPMMLTLLVTSVITGFLMSRTGRYKIFPVVGLFIIAVGMFAFSTVTLDTPIVQICGYMAVVGIGIGMSMQVLTIIVQNSFSQRMVGTATAANNYFRQVGATLGAAVVGSLFATRLVRLVEDHLGQTTGSAPDTSSFTPAAIADLPESVARPIQEAYNEALMPIYLFLVPLAVIAAVTLMFVVEKPLARTVHGALAEEGAAVASPGDESESAKNFSMPGELVEEKSRSWR